MVTTLQIGDFDAPEDICTVTHDAASEPTLSMYYNCDKLNK